MSRPVSNPTMSRSLALASPAGGFLFLLALLTLSAHFLRPPRPAPGHLNLDLAA